MTYTPDPAAVTCAARAMKAVGELIEEDGAWYSNLAEAVIVAVFTEGHLVPKGAERAHSHNHGCVECAAMFGGPEQQGRYGLCADHREQSEAALAEAVALLRRPCHSLKALDELDGDVERFLAAQEGDR